MHLLGRLGLIMASALLVIASFPPFPGRFVALVAWVPLLLSIRGASPRLAFYLGVAHGMMVFGGTLIWLLEIFGPFALLLHFILSMFTGVFAMITANFVKKIRKEWLIGPAVAVAWAGIEFFRGEWFTLRFPWITPGTALPPGILTPWIGVYGISLLVLLGSTWMISARAKTRFAGMAVLSLITASIVFLDQTVEIKGKPIHVAAIQGEVLGFDEYLDLSRSADHPADAIVWPEYALRSDVRSHTAQLESIRDVMREKETKVFVAGGRVNLEEESWGNTAFLIGQDELLGSHQKNRPVHFFDDGEPGLEAPSWPTPLGRIATPICFDNDYATVPRRAVANGAELLLIPSMDAAHWTARQHLQHGELFRHRAAENGRWLVVSASSGLTQIINPKGHQVATLPLFEQGVLNGEVAAVRTLTPYTRFGWLLGPITTILAACLVIASYFMRDPGNRPDHEVAEHPRI